MARRLLVFLTLVLFAGAALAAEQHRHTIVIRDGKTIIDGDFRRTFLGVSPADMSSELREYFGAPKDAGVLIQAVTENGPAAKAGLRVGDVVTAVDGKPVDGAWDIGEAISDKKSGDSVRIELIRAHSRQTLVATLEERDLSPALRTLTLPRIERELNAAGLPGWRARVEANDNCNDLQTRIKEMETRLHELEKKLPK